MTNWRKRTSNITPADIAKYRAEANVPAQEVIEHLYRAMLAVKSITMKDGSLVELVPLVAPEVNEDGRVECGIDARLPGGGHLEFMLQNTGWGRPLGSLAERIRQDRRKDWPR